MLERQVIRSGAKHLALLLSVPAPSLERSGSTELAEVLVMTQYNTVWQGFPKRQRMRLGAPTSSAAWGWLNSNEEPFYTAQKFLIIGIIPAQAGIHSIIIPSEVLSVVEGRGRRAY